jgi:hypothetical protein
MTDTEIGVCGHQYATAWLAANGFNHHRDAKQRSTTDITATKGIITYLVQVKTGVLFSDSPSFPSNERRAMASRATRLGYEAWAALVVINIRGGLVGKICWEKLN